MVRVQLLGSPQEVAAVADALRSVTEVTGQSAQKPAETPGHVIVHLKARVRREP